MDEKYTNTNDFNANDNNENTTGVMGESEKKVSIGQFMKGANNIFKLSTDNEKKQKMFDEYIGQHIYNKYISFADKVDIVNRIIKSSCYVTVGTDENQITVFKQNSPAKHMLYCLYLAKCYTDINITFTNSVEEYDALMENGVLRYLLESIPRDEYDEFAIIQDMEMDDIMENERSAVGLVENTKLALGKAVNTFIEQFVEVISNNPDGAEKVMEKVLEFSERKE